jgi:hypothetical protein
MHQVSVYHTVPNNSCLLQLLCHSTYIYIFRIWLSTVGGPLVLANPSIKNNVADQNAETAKFK